MAYDLHITRREFWSYTGTGLDITAEEWRALVDADPELSWRPERGPDVAEWTGPAPAAAGRFLSLEYGNIVAKNPDPRFLDKMVALSGILKARVQGLNGECYDGSGAPILEAPGLLERIAELFMPRRRR